VLLGPIEYDESASVKSVVGDVAVTTGHVLQSPGAFKTTPVLLAKVTRLFASSRDEDESCARTPENRRNGHVSADPLPFREVVQESPEEPVPIAHAGKLDGIGADKPDDTRAAAADFQSSGGSCITHRSPKTAARTMRMIEAVEFTIDAPR
jgi:hypothetical protein